MQTRIYLCIDLKTFYASVECVERGLDPFTTNLVVADPSRGRGGICLAISPKMKSLGIRNRCRIFEIPKHISYITALPRMKLYMEYAANIYAIYLKYISPDDIYVYSIDEVFIDITKYLKLYQLSPRQLAKKIIDDIYQSTGITATVGMGTNLYLSKIALDITAKHVKSHIGALNQKIYQQTLWHYQPLTDFWQIGRGISKRLDKLGLHDMYDIAHCPQDILYKEFGVNAEILIDHAWGKEPTTIADIKAYKPKNHCISQGQILSTDYQYDDALLALKEMVELKVLDLVDQHLVSNHISLYVGYSKNVTKATGGSRKISVCTNSYQRLLEEFINLFQATTKRNYPIRRINISLTIMDEYYESYDLFTDFESLEKEKKLQKSLIEIKQKYGKNAILKGMNLYEKATTKQRNRLIGGHNAE